MKKFMVLAMVMGIASFAVAGFVATVQDVEVAEVQAGDTVKICLVADADVLSGFAANVEIFINGLDDVQMVGTPGYINPGFTNQFSGPGFPGGATDNELILGAFGGYNLGSPAVVAGSDLFCFTFDVPMDLVFSDEITIDTFSAFGVDSQIDGVAIAPLTLHVVPEPISMSLLGLGGLFLRRRS